MASVAAAAAASADFFIFIAHLLTLLRRFTSKHLRPCLHAAMWLYALTDPKQASGQLQNNQ
jgi:hypothetical protein